MFGTDVEDRVKGHILYGRAAGINLGAATSHHVFLYVMDVCRCLSNTQLR